MFTKTVYDPDAQPPFRFGCADGYRDCSFVFDDMRAKFGLQVLTEDPVIADLFGIEVIDFEKDDFDGRVNRSQELGNLAFTVVTDVVDPEVSPWEDCLLDAVNSLELLSCREANERDLTQFSYAVVLVDLSKWLGYDADKEKEVLRILRREITKRLEQKAIVSLCVYNKDFCVVCQYHGNDRFEIWEAAQKDYP